MSQMKAVERNALVRIIKQRFDLLRKHMDEREFDLKQSIFKRIVDDNARLCEQARRDARKLEAQGERLRKDAIALVKKYQALGVTPGRVKEDYDVRYGHSYGPRSLVKVEIDNRWMPHNLQKSIERVLALLKREAGLGELALAEREQQLIEQVLLDNIESERAREVLGLVPSIDALSAAQIEQKV